MWDVADKWPVLVVHPLQDQQQRRHVVIFKLFSWRFLKKATMFFTLTSTDDQLKQTKPVSVWKMEVFNVLYLLSDTYKLTFITLNSVRSPNNKCTMFTAGMRTNDLIFEQLRINKLIKNGKISMKPKQTGMLPTQNRKKIITFDNILGYICIF